MRSGGGWVADKRPISEPLPYRCHTESSPEACLSATWDRDAPPMMIEFPLVLFVEPTTGNVGGNGLDELLEVLAEVGLAAASACDR